MHFNSLSQLAPEHARRRLEAVDLEEKSKLAEGLALIALIDRRRDFLEAGYASMHAYCTGKLRWSEQRAYRRIQAARLGQRVPLVFECLADGRITVSNACELGAVLTPENATELLAATAFQSKLDVRRLAMERSKPATKPAPPAETEDELAPARVDPHVEPASAPNAPAESVDSLAPARVDRHDRRGRVTPQLDGSFHAHLELTAEEHALLARAQDLLAHVVRDGDPAVVVARALESLVEKLEKQRFGAGSASATPRHVPRGRHIPKALRKHVAERDGNCCAFVGADGHRCGETRGLQFDHIVPIALGGATSASNLRMLCAAHNRFEADRLLGKDNVAAIRERRGRAAALAAEAKAREAKRQEEREEAPVPPTPLQDTIAALAALGFRIADARWAANQTESPNDEPIGERVKRAIRLLSGPIMERSARWAKATT